MSAVTGSLVIACTPAEAFRYSGDPERRAEWQGAVRTTAVETPGPLGVSTRVREMRRVPGGSRELAWEFIHYAEPPRRSVKSPTPHRLWPASRTLPPRDAGQRRSGGGC